MQVSVAIIAKDAASTLGACLTSLARLSQDIVVVIDDRTTDSTAHLARKYTSQVFIRKFTDFSDQKNFAASRALNSWIFSLDADEICTHQLVDEILNLPPSPKAAAFWVPRINQIFGRQIRHTNWDPDGIIRLYDKSKASWRGQVHEQIQTGLPVARLKAAIFHTSYRTVEEFLTKQNAYSSAQADQLSQAGVKFNPISLVLSGVYDFGRRYFWHAGFLDGWHGLFLSYLMVTYHLSVWIKLWQKQNPSSA